MSRGTAGTGITGAQPTGTEYAQIAASTVTSGVKYRPDGGAAMGTGSLRPFFDGVLEVFWPSGLKQARKGFLKLEIAGKGCAF
jgi:hypothetical protein